MLIIFGSVQISVINISIFFCFDAKETKNQGTRRSPVSFLRHFLTLNWETKNRSGAPVPPVKQLLFLIQFKNKKYLK
jgi:hypothetical protein